MIFCSRGLESWDEEEEKNDDNDGDDPKDDVRSSLFLSQFPYSLVLFLSVFSLRVLRFQPWFSFGGVRGGVPLREDPGCDPWLFEVGSYRTGYF